MRRAAWVLLLCGVLGCGPGPYWVKPYVSAEQARLDSYECERDAGAQYYRSILAFWFRHSWYERCMVAHGYHQVRDSNPLVPDSSGYAENSSQREEAPPPCSHFDPPGCQTRCDEGNMESCAILGWMYSEGYGVARNPDQSVKLYERACEGGDPKSCQILNRPRWTPQNRPMVDG